MASQRSTNTMAEVLQRIMGEIAKAKALPDSDIEFLVELETAIIEYLRAPESPEAQQAGPPPPPPMMGGSMGMGPPDAMGLPPGVPAGGGGMPQIPPEELARMLPG